MSFDCSKASGFIVEPLPTRIGRTDGRKYRTVFEVLKINDGCPVYSIGDKIVFDDDVVNEKESSFVCKLALSSFSTRYSWFRGNDQAANNMVEDGDVWLACPAPGPPFTKYGRVIFKVSRQPLETK
jgi:uncharacterized repeat protein (TIGR04076 family)